MRASPFPFLSLSRAHTQTCARFPLITIYLVWFILQFNAYWCECVNQRMYAQNTCARACVLTFSLLNFQKQTRLPVSSAVRRKFNAKKTNFLHRFAIFSSFSQSAIFYYKSWKKLERSDFNSVTVISRSVSSVHNKLYRRTLKDYNFKILYRKKPNDSEMQKQSFLFAFLSFICYLGRCKLFWWKEKNSVLMIARCFCIYYTHFLYVCLFVFVTVA